jgi:mannonate dehydratase
MYLGTQIRPRDDDDYRVWAQLGVKHVCVDPPGNPHQWSLDDLNRVREHVEKFGLTLDMVQFPWHRVQSRRRRARISCLAKSRGGSASWIRSAD